MYATLDAEISQVDDIERFNDANEMIENVIESLLNYSNDLSLHCELINNGIIEVIRKYIELFMGCAKKENSVGEDETVVGIDLDVMPMNAL